MYGFDPRISASQIIYDPSGLVAAVVVYQNYLVNVIVVEVNQAGNQRTDVHFFIVAMNNHGNGLPEGIVDRQAHSRGSHRNRRLLRVYEDRSGKSLRRSEEHTSELQSHLNIVCRLLLEN